MSRAKLAAAFAALALFCAPAYAAQAKVVSVEGDVQVRASASDAWRALKPGDVLNPGAEILAGAGSCELSLGEGNKSIVRIQKNSKATLNSLDPVKVDLVSGRIFSLVRSIRPGSTFEVNSPTAIASARGTGWAQETDSISVFEDTVHVTGDSGEQADVNENEGITLEEDGGLGEPFDLPPDAIKEWSEFEVEAEKHLSVPENTSESSQSAESSESESEEDITEQEPEGAIAEEALLEGKDLSNEAEDQEEIEDEMDEDDGHGTDGGGTTGTT